MASPFPFTYPLPNRKRLWRLGSATIPRGRKTKAQKTSKKSAIQCPIGRSGDVLPTGGGACLRSCRSHPGSYPELTRFPSGTPLPCPRPLWAHAEDRLAGRPNGRSRVALPPVTPRPIELVSANLGCDPSRRTGSVTPGRRRASPRSKLGNGEEEKRGHEHSPAETVGITPVQSNSSQRVRWCH